MGSSPMPHGAKTVTGGSPASICPWKLAPPVWVRTRSPGRGSDSGTTWLSENAEIAILYGSLMEASIYMKGEQDMMALYEKRFTEAVSGLKVLGEAKEVTDEYRTGKLIRPKQ